MAAEKKSNYTTNLDINVATTAHMLHSSSPQMAQTNTISTKHLTSSNPINIESESHISHSTKHHLSPQLSNAREMRNIDTKASYPTNNTRSKWSCIQCTFLNDSIYFACNICHTAKPPDTKPLHVIEEMDEKQQAPSIINRSWKCSVCTLLNEARILRCVACYEPKSDIKTSHNRLNDRKSSTPTSLDTAKLKWNCDRCNDENDFDSPFCMRCGEEQKATDIQNINPRDWTCDICKFINDWNLTQDHQVPCCLKCGAPNLKLCKSCDVDTMPPLEQATATLLSDLPALDDWKCCQCGSINACHDRKCMKCNDIERKSDIVIDCNNEISFRITDCDKEDAIHVGRYKYNELSETQQEYLVEGYCRKYANIVTSAHALWKQTVLWCFGCYVGRDTLYVMEDILSFRFYGSEKCKEDYVYSWKLRIKTRDRKVIKSMLIGLMNAKLEINYAIYGSGARIACDDNYCDKLRFGDVIVMKYDKKQALLEYGIGDKWFGIAFDRIKPEQYQLVVCMNDSAIKCDVDLLEHHWTS